MFCSGECGGENGGKKGQGGVGLAVEEVPKHEQLLVLMDANARTGGKRKEGWEVKITTHERKGVDITDQNTDTHLFSFLRSSARSLLETLGL